MLQKVYKLLFITFIVSHSMTLGQSRYTNCGRLGVEVGNLGTVSEYDWPRDFQYSSNGGGNIFDLLIEDWSKPDGNLDGYAVPGDLDIGDWKPVYIRKVIKYEYPQIIVDGEDISSTDVYDEIDPTLPSDQMIETFANCYLGLSFKQQVYAWSHPKYQDFVLIHLQIINTGNQDDDAEIELPDNSFSALYFFEINTFKPGKGSHDELCDRDHEKGDRPDIYSQNEIWVFEGDDPTHSGVLNPENPQLLHVSVGNDPNDSWFGKPVNNEGDPKPETGEFMSPMYVGEGIIHIDKSAVDRSHDLSKLKILLWDTHYWLFHGDTGPRKSRYDIYRNGYQGVQFTEDNTKGTTPEVVGGQRSLTTFGPWDGFAVGDTINLVFFRGVKGIHFDIAKEKGAQWLKWWETGEGSFDTEAKNELIRTGRDSLIELYNNAKAIWENEMVLPTGWNPQPPKYLKISNTDENYIAVNWQAPDDNIDIVSYRIYYALGSRDARYNLLEEVDAVPGQTDYEYLYKQPKAGFAHYFRLTAVDAAGNESSHYLCRTNRLAMYPGLAMGNSIDAVRVVPNPFVYDKDAIKNYPGEKDKIMIAGLPPGRSEIRIYTLSGDLVREFVHDANTGGNDGIDYSNLKKGRTYLTITGNNQYMASGVYVYHVKNLDGYGEKTGKFIVIR